MSDFTRSKHIDLLLKFPSWQKFFFSISVLHIPALFHYLTGFCRLMDYGKLGGGVWEDEFCAKDSFKQLPGFHDFPPRCLVLKTWSRRVIQAAWLSKIDRGTKSRWCVIKALTYQCICTSPCSSVQLKVITSPSPRRPSGEMAMVNDPISTY